MKPVPTKLLRKRYQQALWMPTVWTAAIGLGLLLFIGKWWGPGDGDQRLYLWLGCLAIIALAAVLVRLRARQSKQSVACALDLELATYNRIEAAEELAHRQDALAEAQRKDTAEFLSARNLSPSWLWPTGLALLLLFGAAHLVTFSVASYHVAEMKAELKAQQLKKEADAKAAEKEEKTAKAKAEIPPATINWISPKAESTGTPIEEIPLTAEAESGTGLKNVTLVVTVNGEAKPEVKLPADLAMGKQPIKLSLYLDELGVQPFDMVSYYLHADRVVPAGVTPESPWPPVASPLQFLQVRPLRDDTRLANGAPPPPNQPPAQQIVNFLRSLKLVQIDLMRDTLALATENPPHTDPAWPELNHAASAAQNALATRTQQAVDEATQSGAPAEIVNLLTQAKDQMQVAAYSLDKPDPVTAQPSQGHALGYLTAVEKYYIKVIGDQRQGPAPPPDPFAVNQPFKLPPREQTPAGQLEQLARDQTQLANQLADANSGNSPGAGAGSGAGASPAAGSNTSNGRGAGAGSGPGSGAGRGTGAGAPKAADITAQQQKLAEAIDKLANSGTLPPEVAPALKAATTASHESAQQLANNDPQAALEPATRAAASLRDAVNTLNAAGKTDTADVLANAQRALNESAGNVAGAGPGNSQGAATAAAQSTAQAEAALRAAATEQQNKGSTDAAQQLADLANAINNSRVQDDLKKLAGEGAAATDGERQAAANKLLGLAQGAANGQGALGNRDQLAQQALDALKRDRVNLDRADKAGPEALRGLQQDAIGQAQIAMAAGQGDGKRVDTPILGPISKLAPPAPPQGDQQHAPFMRMAGSQIDELIKILSKQIAADRPQVLTTAQTGDAPPAYRPAVADYFESLAHEQDTAPAPAQP